jgi:choline kinase
MINVVILAAGDGERLGFCVKSIEPIGDTCTMRNIVQTFEALGRRTGQPVQFVIVTGFRAQQLREWFAGAESRSNISLVYDELFYKKETGASLAMAFQNASLPGGTFVVNGDLFIAEPDSTGLMDQLNAMRHHDGLAILTAPCEPDDTEAVRVMSHGSGRERHVERIVRGEGYDSDLEAVGIFHLAAAAAGEYRCDERTKSQEDIYTWLHDTRGVGMRAFVTREFIKEIDDAVDLTEVKAFVNSGQQSAAAPR